MITIRATYRDLWGTMTLWLEPRIPPIMIRTFWGTVTDAQTGAPLSGVTVQILDGPNANRSTMTGADGTYRMENMGLSHTSPFIGFQVRFSKPGYAAFQRSKVMTTNQSNDLNVSLERSD